MKRHIYQLLAIVLCLVACNRRPSDALPLDKEPTLYPALSGATLPLNIAAPSFRIEEEGRDYYTEIGIVGEEPSISLGSSSANVVPPLEKWKEMLSKGAGKEIYIRVFLTDENGRSRQMNDVVCSVSKDTIDSHIAYRLLYPGYELWREMGIYQRDLTSYKVTPIIENSKIDNQCVNCHSFSGGSSERMMIHVRGKQGGTLVRRDGRTYKVNPKCKDLQNGATYPAWHPSGRFIAFSANDIKQFFHSKGTKTIEVSDLSADMTLYDVEKDETIVVPGLNGKEWMETFPTWSPDGKMLYFCRARGYNEGEALDSIRYDLCQIPFDERRRQFGEPQVVFAASSKGKSVSFPRVSPDGNWLLFTLSDYGNFSIWHPESDLWLLNLKTGDGKPAGNINSNDVESYHSWSSNGKWIVFSSKRMDGLWARPYIAFFNPATGEFGKPFVLPQQQPDYYDKFMKTFNIPEFIKTPVQRTDEFAAAVKGE